MFHTQNSSTKFKITCVLFGALFLPNTVTGVMLAAQAQDVVVVQSNSTLDLQVIKSKSIKVQNPVRGTGTIFAQKTSKIGPLVEGQILQIHVKVGDRINKGQPLFEIDQDSYQFMHDEALTRLAMAEARIMNAKPAYERTKKLYKNENTTLARLDKATSSLAVVRAEVAAANVAVARTKKNLENTIAYAPFNAVVTARFNDEGVYVSNRVPGGSSAIVELQKIDTVVAIVQIPVRALEKIQVGAFVKLKIDGISKPVEAKISVINDKVDIATRTLEVRIAIRNGDYAIKPGLFIQAEILPKSREALVIPRHTIKGSQGNQYVYILENGKAVRKNVKVSDYDARLVEIISGLTGNVSVLSGTGLNDITNGMEIGEIADVAG